MDSIEPMSLSKLRNITNFTISVTPMAILNEHSIFGCTYTNAYINTDQKINMDCAESNLGPSFSIHFKIPDVENKLDIFDGLATTSFSFEIECPSNYVALCSHNDYRVRSSFNRLVPSEKLGTDEIF